MFAPLIAPVSGRAYFTPGSYTTLLAAANTFYAVPFMAGPRGFTPSAVGVNVTTAGVGAGADVRLALYADDGGRPGALIQDFGAITALTSTGAFSVTLSGGAFPLKPLLVPGQVYWLASCFNTAATTMPTVAALDTGVVPQNVAGALGVAAIANLPSSAATAGVAVSGSMTYGAFASTAPTNTVILNGKAPLVGLLHA